MHVRLKTVTVILIASRTHLYEALLLNGPGSVRQDCTNAIFYLAQPGATEQREPCRAPRKARHGWVKFDALNKPWPIDTQTEI